MCIGGIRNERRGNMTLISYGHLILLILTVLLASASLNGPAAKALLAVAQEQMLVVELETRLLDAEKARSKLQDLFQRVYSKLNPCC